MTIYNRELRWRQLIPGAFVVVALVFLALIIIVRVGLGNLPGKKFTMYSLTDQARGILHGSDVWLAGQKVGMVTDVIFLPVSATGSNRVLLKLAVLRENMRLVRKDSRAQVSAGSRLIGNPVLHISFGSMNSAMIQEGDTIGMLPQFDGEVLASKVDAAMKMFPLLKRDLDTIVANASGLDATLKLISMSGEPGAAQSQLQTLLASLLQVSASLDSGSFGLFMNDARLVDRMNSVMANTGTLSRKYNIEGSSLGKFVQDTSFFTKIDSITVRFTRTMAALETKVNLKTGPRADELRYAIDRLTASLRALRDDARRHPFRYLVF